jgi:hypothetical protein
VTVDADDLYGLPLERFVAERGALARALRGEGRREEAAAVAGLRKPSVAAWAVNQLVRTQDAGVRALLEAGDVVREAQAALLAGGADSRAVRAAAGAERAAVDRLVAAAGGLLSAEGHELSAAVIDRVADTLHAAALDEDARREVEGGRLARELRHVGLGDGLLAASPPPPDRAPAPCPGRAAPPVAERAPGTPRSGRRATRDQGGPDAEGAARAAQAAPAERAERERAARERTAAEAAARAASLAARRLAERADRAVRSAEERRERATQALGAADAALAAAQAQAQAAARARQEAEAEVERLRVGAGAPTPRGRPRRA